MSRRQLNQQLKVFITGITGQDGSFLAEQLGQEGVEVHGLVRKAIGIPSQAGGSSQIKYHVGDLADSERLHTLIELVEPDVIFNLGGLTSVAESWTAPATTARLAGVAAVELLESALQVQNRLGKEITFVQASSAEIFGAPTRAPQTETSVISPTNPYGAAKAYAHHMVAVYRARGLRASSMILYNHESHRRPPHFVTRKITQGVAKITCGLERKLTLGSLDTRRDWGWAPDYVRGMIAASRRDVPGDYVLATGTSHSIADLVQTAFRSAGIDEWDRYVELDKRFSRPSDASELRGDYSKAQQDLAWSPTVSFEEMIGIMTRFDIHEIETNNSRLGNVGP